MYANDVSMDAKIQDSLFVAEFQSRECALSFPKQRSFALNSRIASNLNRMRVLCKIHERTITVYASASVARCVLIMIRLRLYYRTESD